MAPAAPIELPSPPPITDRIALGALTSTFPPELVDRVVAATGRAEQRRRLLPARVVVYFVLALALYSHAAYEEVLRCLVEGLGRAGAAGRIGMCRVPRRWASTLSGSGPSRSRCCSPRPPGRWQRWPPGARGIAAGGCWCWTGPAWMCRTRPKTLPRSGGPAAAAGGQGRVPAGPGGGAGGGRHARDRPPPLRVPTAAGSRRWPAGWPAGAARWARWAPGCCCWPTGCLQARSCGRPWPAPARIWCGGSSAQQDRPKLPVDQVLADGSWLSRSYAASDRRRRHPIVVRVVEYSLSDPGRRTSVDATGW